MSFRDEVRLTIERVRDDMANALANGTAADFADYRHRTGQILGLTTALDIMDETARRLNEAAGLKQER